MTDETIGTTGADAVDPVAPLADAPPSAEPLGPAGGGIRSRISARINLTVGVDLTGYIPPFGLILAAHIVAAFIFLTRTTSGEAAGLSGLPSDESWARMVYAQNIAESFRLDFNPGDAEAGATSLLWVIVLGLTSSLTGLAGISVVITAKILGVILAAVAGLLIMVIVERFTGLRRLGLVAGIVTAIEPSFAFASVAGVEAPLFSVLALGATWSYFKDRLQMSGFLMGLMIITRPESWILVILAVLALVGRRLWDRSEVQLVTGEDSKAIARLLPRPIVLMIAWATMNVIVSGAPLPNAYYVVRDQVGFMPLENLLDVVRGYYGHLSFFPRAAFPISVATVIWGAVALLRRHSFPAAPRPSLSPPRHTQSPRIWNCRRTGSVSTSADTWIRLFHS